MVALPPIAPIVGWRGAIRLARDHYVRVASNDYSVHPSAIGRLVEVAADLEHVAVTCAGQVVAQHERCWDLHQTFTDPAHARAAAALRSARLHVATAPLDPEVEQRSLSDRVSQVSTRIGLPSRKAPLSSTASRKNVA